MIYCTHAVLVYTPTEVKVFGLDMMELPADPDKADEEASRAAREWPGPFRAVAVRLLTHQLVNPSKPPHALTPSLN